MQPYYCFRDFSRRRIGLVTVDTYESTFSVDWPVFFFQAEDGIRDFHVTGVQTCALPIFLRVGVLVCRPPSEHVEADVSARVRRVRYVDDPLTVEEYLDAVALGEDADEV